MKAKCITFDYTEFVFSCTTSRFHATLSLLWGSQTVSIPSLKYTSLEVRVRAVLPSPLTIQIRAPWSCMVPSRSLGCRKSQHSLVVPGHLSALQCIDGAILRMQICLCRCTQGGFSSDQVRCQDHPKSEAYLPKNSGPALLQLLCFCHLSY